MVPLPVPKQSRSAVPAIRRRLEALRAEAGEETDFVLDGAGALDPDVAASLSSELERFHLLWFDEPCAVSQRAALRKLAGGCVTPLGFDIDICELRVFRDLVRDYGIDIFRPDFAVHGISEIRRMAAIAETQYLAVAPRHEGGPVATAAALHLAASLPNFFIQEIPVPQAERDRQMRVEIAGPGIELVKEGYAALPSGPGLGITVNEAALETHRDR
jgi:galactonate dehydratase